MASTMPSDGNDNDEVRRPDACYVDRLVDSDSFYVPPECPDGISQAEWQDILNQSMYDEDERQYAEKTAQDLAEMLSSVNDRIKKELAAQQDHARTLRHDEIRRRMLTFGNMLKSLNRARQYEKESSKGVLSAVIKAIEEYARDDKITDIRISSEDYEVFTDLLETTTLKKQLSESDKQILLDTLAIEVTDDCDEYDYNADC